MERIDWQAVSFVGSLVFLFGWFVAFNVALWSQY